MAIKEKEIQKFIKSYSTNSSNLWRVILPDGHGGQIRKRGFLTKSDAVSFASKEYLKVLSQTKSLRTDTSTLLFSEYAKQWLLSKRRNGLKESSAMKYDNDISRRLNPFFGAFKLVNLERYHLHNYIRELQELETTSATLRYSVTLFKSIIKQAEVDDLIDVKGICLVPTPKHKKADPQFWDHNQVTYFLSSTESNKNHNLWTVALYTGMRAGELAGLKWDCIHFDRSFGNYTGAIEVRRIYNQKTRRMEETTKNGDRRIIPIFFECRTALQKLKASSTSEFVFGGLEAVDSSHFNRQLQSALKRLPQLPRVTFHGLRHSFCSYLDSTGMSRRIVSEIMGHRDLNTTNRYSHVNNQMLGFEVSRWLTEQNKQKSSNLQAAGF